MPKTTSRISAFGVVVLVLLCALFFTPSLRQCRLPISTLRSRQAQHEAEAEQPALDASSYWQDAILESPPTLLFNVKGHHQAHNYEGPGHKTFATIYGPRNGRLNPTDYYAIQQLIFRILWRGNSKSKYPMTVFVTQHVSSTERNAFKVAGALVRDIDDHFDLGTVGAPRILHGMLTFFDLWKQSDFDRIAYIDPQAVVLENIDTLLDQSPVQACKITPVPGLSTPEQALLGAVGDTSRCHYVFAAVPESDNIRTGVMILKPDMAMHQRLLLTVADISGHETSKMSQSLLSHVFRQGGSFPATLLHHKWNSEARLGQLTRLKIALDKPASRAEHALDKMAVDWLQVFHEMKQFYAGEQFWRMRMDD